MCCRVQCGLALPTKSLRQKKKRRKKRKKDPNQCDEGKRLKQSTQREGCADTDARMRWIVLAPMHLTVENSFPLWVFHDLRIAENCCIPTTDSRYRTHDHTLCLLLPSAVISMSDGPLQPVGATPPVTAPATATGTTPGGPPAPIPSPLHRLESHLASSLHQLWTSALIVEQGVAPPPSSMAHDPRLERMMGMTQPKMNQHDLTNQNLQKQVSVGDNKNALYTDRAHG